MDLVRRLKLDAFTAIVPVTVLAADHNAEQVQAWFGAGADEVVTGIFSPAEQRARLDAMLVRTERDVSVHPSTRLPGTTEIEREIRRRLESDQEFAVCYADLDHFKEFNDRYSYYDGDRVIYLLSRILHDVVKGLLGPRGFVGHIGGDDFIFVIPAEEISAVCSEILDVFDTLIPLQYNDQDRRAGYFFGKDRRGQLHRVPLMTLSIGIVTNRHRRFAHPAQVSELADRDEELRQDPPRARSSSSTGAREPTAKSGLARRPENTREDEAMNVSCPNCATVFRVDPTKVPEGGVRARCNVCSAVFAVGREPEARATPHAAGPGAGLCAAHDIGQPRARGYSDLRVRRSTRCAEQRPVGRPRGRRLRDWQLRRCGRGRCYTAGAWFRRRLRFRAHAHASARGADAPRAGPRDPGSPAVPIARDPPGRSSWRRFSPGQLPATGRARWGSSGPRHRRAGRRRRTCHRPPPFLALARRLRLHLRRPLRPPLRRAHRPRHPRSRRHPKPPAPARAP